MKRYFKREAQSLTILKAWFTWSLCGLPLLLQWQFKFKYCSIIHNCFVRLKNNWRLLIYFFNIQITKILSVFLDYRNMTLIWFFTLVQSLWILCSIWEFKPYDSISHSLIFCIFLFSINILLSFKQQLGKGLHGAGCVSEVMRLRPNM